MSLVNKEVTIDREFGALKREKSQSGVQLKVVYTPEDIKDKDYSRDIGNPGEFPYTRGIYPKMYRERLWLKTSQVSYTTPEETNKAYKEAIAAGLTGLRLVFDVAQTGGVDPDHPLGQYGTGSGGCAVFSLSEHEKMFRDINFENVDLESGCISTPGALSSYVFVVALAEERGFNIANLRGTILNDPLLDLIECEILGFPLEIARRVNGDLIEFSVKNTPKWFACVPCGYNMREAGANTFQEIAFCLATAIQCYGDVIRERGVKLDDFRPVVFSLSGHSDFFETICKCRSIRRMWARIAKERLGATKPHAMRCRLAIQTAGSSLQAQKPINNAARITLDLLAAVLGGVQSLQPVSFDEAFGIPSLESRVFGIDAQHIIDHEGNASLVADPLGGSYYVEWLTDKIEEEASKLLAEVDRRGGMWECIKSGWYREQLVNNFVQAQEEVRKGKRLVVGVSAFQGEDGPVSKAIIDAAYRTPPQEKRLEAVQAVKKLRETRNVQKVEDTLKELYRVAKEGGNLVRPCIEVAKAYATVGEIVGVIRMAYNCSYDPYRLIEKPAFLSGL